MAKPADGYSEGFQQYEAEADDGLELCDDCDVEFVVGDTYWTRDDEVLCESCFAEWREEND